jgi:hypothetical protein
MYAINISVSGGTLRYFIRGKWYARKRRLESTDIMALDFRFIHLYQVNTAECANRYKYVTSLN